MALHIDGKVYNANRKKLAEVLPLAFPYSVKLFVSNVCNFRCFYCYQAESGSGEENGLLRRLMDMEVYRKCIDGIASGGSLKKLLLYGNGEPLLHPRLPEMVEYAKKRGVADTVEVITNASLLTPALTRALTDAGLDRLRVSLQGLNSGDYQKNAGAVIHYEDFRENLRYFYEHKKSTQVLIKILDVMLLDESARERFYREYEPICDEIAVEHLIPLVPMEGVPEAAVGMRGNAVVQTELCSFPFYSCTVDCDGQVTPCCRVPFPRKFGSAEHFSDIWNGAEYQGFLRQFLKGGKTSIPACSGCKIPAYTTQPSDYLDGDRKTLYSRFEEDK